MPGSTFDDLLLEADATAREARWQQTFETLSRASLLQPRHAGVISGLGTCLVQLGQPALALPYFRQAVQLEPASAEAHNNLGVAYLLAGEPGPAEAACRQALANDAEHVPAWRNLALACLRLGRAQEGLSILAAIVQAHPDDVEAMLLLARCYAGAGQAQSARFLYSRVLKAQPDSAEARMGLTALDPRPALPGTDVSRLARAEHAGKLAGLKARIAPAALAPSGSATLSAALPQSAPLSVAFYGPAEVSLGARTSVPAAALRQSGHRVAEGLSPAAAPGGYDIYVISRPQLLANSLQLMAQCRQAGARIIVDLDDDFHQLPPDHPGYKYAGPGNPANLRLLENAIAQADLLITATPVLAERYGSYARRVAVLPHGWCEANPLWNKPAARHKTLNIGWAGAVTHRSNFALIRPALVRLLREVPEAQLVIGGDPAIYESLSALPESRRLFLPMASYEDYPYLLSYFDILLAPLRDNPFNQAKSDIKLLEAGIRRIPWVGSPCPAYKAWGVGGILADEPDEWYAALRQLVADPAARQSLGAAGRAQAETRESQELGLAWEAALAMLAAAPAGAPAAVA